MYKIIEEKLVNYGTVGGERTAFVLVHIICDTVSGMPQPLPHWVAGSRCDVLEHNGSVYLLSNSRQWEQVNFYNQGEGRGFDPDNYYTKTETDYEITEKVAEIVADAPEDFDTLKEMSDWIDSHEDSAAAMNSAIQANTTAIAGKVDKVTGKGLSTEDYTPAEKTKLAGLSNYDDTALQTAVANKVDKVSGKGLSTEDYTTVEKTKLAGIEAGANNVTVDSDLSSSSENPVQNKAINSALNSYLPKNRIAVLEQTFNASNSSSTTVNWTIPAGWDAKKICVLSTMVKYPFFPYDSWDDGVSATPKAVTHVRESISTPVFSVIEKYTSSLTSCKIRIVLFLMD